MELTREGSFEYAAAAMRRGPGTALIAVFVLAFGANLRSGANDYELTPRQGVPARVMLKGCHKLESIAVDFDGNGDRYQAQWWRCGPQNPNWKKGLFPISYVLVQPPRGKAGRSGITLSNSGSSDQYFFEQPQKINIEPGSRQLLLVSGRYYDTEEGKTSCLLGPVGEEFECWPSGETERIVEQNSRKQEKSLFRKVDDFLRGQPFRTRSAWSALEEAGRQPIPPVGPDP